MKGPLNREGGAYIKWNGPMRRDFLVFKSRQICCLENFIENFITFQLLDSSTVHIYETFLL